MKGHRKFLLISGFFIIDILLVIGILLICRTTLNKTLEKEVNSLVSFDVISDRYNTDIKMRGNYGKVEEAIKSYLDNYALGVQTVLNSIDYQKLDNFINNSYYLNDISVFKNDLLYLNKLKQSFNDDYLLLINDNEKVIYDYIYNYVDNVYFVKLYNNLIDGEVMNIIRESNNYLEFKKLAINAYIGSIYNYISFLERNSNNYIIVEGNIQFDNNDLEIEYFKLVDKIKESKI